MTVQARLFIDAAGYRLAWRNGEAWTEVAVLAGGADRLLPAGRPIGQAALEAAIEHAEDWLMPHAAGLAGALLEVTDVTGRLAAGLHAVFASDARAWDAAQLEALFLQLDFMSTRPHLAAQLQARREFVADIVLLRELAHHGRLDSIRLLSGGAS